MAAVASGSPENFVVDHLADHLDQAARAADGILAKARSRVAARLMPGGKGTTQSAGTRAISA